MPPASKKSARNKRNAGKAPADLRARNSYDFVRFCAACFVLFSHHFDLAGLAEPIVPGFREDFGELGVEIFFCLSGFLICLSLQRSSDWALFVSARVLRIFPNLAFVLVTTSVFTLVWYGNGSNLWSHATYVVSNLMMFVTGVTYVIPGIFTDTLRPIVNEPLWTLPYELWLYVVLFLMFALGRGRSAACVIAGALAVSIGWSAASLFGEFKLGPLGSADIFRFGSYFLSGAVLAVFWSRIARYSIAIGVAGLVGIFLLRNLLPVDTIFHSLALAAAIVGLGNSTVMSWFSRGGDASYGMYVFAWPVQQFCLLLIGSFWLSMVAAFLITVAIGYFTWHAFERRAMSYREQLAQGLRRDN